jgi:hypothetical protein
MLENGSRRNLLTGAAAVLGVLGIGGVASRVRASSAPSPSSPKWRETVVSEVRGGAVRVNGSDQWLRLEGFPDRWRALAGDKVVMAPSGAGTGLSVQPLTHWVVAQAAPASLVAGARIGGAQGPVIDRATVVAAGLTGARSTGVRVPRQLMVAVADRTSSPGRAVAIREAN